MASPRSCPALLVAASALLGCTGAAKPADTPQASAVPAEAASAPGPGVGQKAPPFAVKGVDGTLLALPNGKATILMFWATWSEPDKKELGKLQDVHLQLGPARVAVLALSVDDEPNALPAFAKTHALTFPIGWDAGHRIAGLYRPWAEPTTYVIDRAGVIRFIHSGYHDGEADVIAAEVASLR